MNTPSLLSLIVRATPLLLAVTAGPAATAADVTVAALSAPTLSSEPGVADDAYARAMQAQLQRQAHYPNSREARQLRPEGTATVWLELDGSGRLVGSGLRQSSRSPLLDDNALQTVRAARYPAFGDAGTRRGFVMPIEFVADGSR